LQYRDIADYDVAQLQRLRMKVFHDTLIGKPEPSEVMALGNGLSIKVSERVEDISAVRWSDM